MKSNSTIDLAYFLTMTLLVTVAFLSFYQSAFGHSLTQFFGNQIQATLPSISGLDQIVLPLTFGLFVATTYFIHRFGGPNKVKLICVFSFLFFLSSALPFSSISWLAKNRTETGFLWFSPFAMTVISGIALLFCFILLNFLSKIRDIREELLFRGGNTLEIESAMVGSFFCALIIAGVSAFLSAIAVLVLMAAKPIGVALIETTPYATLVFGVGAIATIISLIYYYLTQNDRRV